METIILKAFKELGQFIGKKLDEVTASVRSTPQKIQIDMSETSNKMGEVKNEITKLIEVIANQPMPESSITQLERIRTAIKEIEMPEMKMMDHSKDLAKIVQSIDKQTKELKPKEKDGKEEKLLASIVDAINNIEIPAVDLSGLKKLGDKLDILIKKEQSTVAVESKLDTLIEKISNISLSVPSTFKLDEMQMRALSNRGISAGGQAVQPARNVTLTNLALTLTSAEYSYTFPANTTRWTIKLRDQGTLGYYSYTTGKLPTVGGGGDGGNYATIPQNFLQSEDNVDWTGKVIYLGAESASQVAEITVYTL